MKLHDVRVHPEADRLARADQLAWKIAEVAADPVAVLPEVTDMIINRVIDNAAVAIAAINRHPVTSARDMALARPHAGGATVFGCGPEVRVHGVNLMRSSGWERLAVDAYDATARLLETPRFRDALGAIAA